MAQSAALLEQLYGSQKKLLNPWMLMTTCKSSLELTLTQKTESGEYTGNPGSRTDLAFVSAFL